MPVNTFINPELMIKVNKNPLPRDIQDSLQEVVVNSDLDLPGMFTLVFNDDELKCLDGDVLKLGAEVEIKIRTSPQARLPPAEGPLITGEITALEPDFSYGLARFIARGYTKQHRLHRGTTAKVWVLVHDSDIARQIASTVGLKAEVDTTLEEYPTVHQRNQTDMEFLRERAQRIGYQVYVSDGTLYFKKGDANLGEGPELTWGKNLHVFRPRLSVANQVEEITVRGWDPKTKKEVVGKAKTDGQLGLGQWRASQPALGSAKATVDAFAVQSAAEGDQMARAVLADVNSDFLQAEGTCFGDPRIQAGKTITIKDVGRRLSGKYQVTSATHVWSNGKYETRFAISGRRSQTVTQLLRAEPDASRKRVSGVVTAIVTNNNLANDNTASGNDWGQVKVRFPWSDEQTESRWARVASPMAGADRGFYCLPEVNDEVLVAFEHGDFDHPYVVGTLWNGKDKPPLPIREAIKDGKVVQHIFKSRSGHVIILDDTQGNERIVVRDKTEKNEIIIDSKENTLTINTDKDIVITAKGNMNLKSTGDMTLEGKNVTVKAQQAGKIEAMQTCSIKGTQSCTVEGTGGLTLKNAAAQVALNGPTVNINNGALEVI